MNSSVDEYYLKKALKLAHLGSGWTNPNPMVGAVIVKNGKIIATGYHKKFGFPHAEIEAIRSANCNLKGFSLYVTLEPCCYFGKTPPCTDAIIKAGIKRVVCCVLDPNPKVYGQGIKALKKAGIEVVNGILENDAKKLNEAFFTFHQKRRPFVVLKFAASLDGKIATKTGNSKWITNEKARKIARNLRSNYQSVLVGINTVISDNPHLGARNKNKKDPLRIIIDPSLRIPFNSSVLRDKNVLLVTSNLASKEKINFFRQKQIPFIKFENKKIPLKKLLEYFRRRNIISIFVEGGTKVLGEFVDEKLVDKFYIFCAPIIIGGDGIGAIDNSGAENIQKALHLKDVNFKKIDNNLLITGYPSFF